MNFERAYEDLTAYVTRAMFRLACNKTIPIGNVLLHTQGTACPALRIDVSAKDQRLLRKLVSGGVQQVQVVLRAWLSCS